MMNQQLHQPHQQQIQQFKQEHQQHQQQQQQQQQNQQQQQQQQQLGPDGKPKRNPYCSRCRNHGKSAQVKGHKRHCEYRDCQCEGCKLVECRQIVSAAQIKRRRYQKQDEECGRRIEISPPVLTRPANSDPATLIAKTLINSKQNSSTTTKHFAAAVAAAGAANGPGSATAASQQHAVQQQLQMQMSSMPAAFRGAVALAAAVASAASSSASAASTTLTSAWPQHTPPSSSSSSAGRGHLSVTQQSTQHLLHMGAGGDNHNIGHQLSSMASGLGRPPLPNGALMPTSGPAPNENHPGPAPSHLLDHGHTIGSPSLRDALHLFHFPNSIFSGAGFGQPPGGGGGGPLHLPQLPGPPPPPQAYSQLSCNNNNNSNSNPALSMGGGGVNCSMGNLLVGGTSERGGCTSGTGGAGTTNSSSNGSPEPTVSLLCPTPASSSPTATPGNNHQQQQHHHHHQLQHQFAQLPMMREQLNLVEEIHRSFGPLVAYAWLRSERFDVAKVRALIDMAEDSFDELLQANGHSPLDLTSPIVD